MLFFISYKLAFDFLKNNSEFINGGLYANARTQDWWSDWGQCTSAVLGGTILGGIGGFNFGPPGAIIGGIGGGLLAAGSASACNSDDDIAENNNDGDCRNPCPTFYIDVCVEYSCEKYVPDEDLNKNLYGSIEDYINEGIDENKDGENIIPMFTL